MSLSQPRALGTLLMRGHRCDVQIHFDPPEIPRTPHTEQRFRRIVTNIDVDQTLFFVCFQQALGLANASTKSQMRGA